MAIQIDQKVIVTGTIGPAEIDRAIARANQDVLARVPSLSIKSVSEHRKFGGAI